METSDERMLVHLANWMRGLEYHPCTIELRSRNEVIDAFEVKEDSPFDVLAYDILDACTNDALNEGKQRVYQLIAITQQGEQYPFSMRIRRRVEQSATDLVKVLSEQMKELHKIIAKERKSNTDMLLDFARRLDDTNARLTAEVDMHRQRSGEVIDKLESLRSKKLERDMAEEKHKSELDIRERLTDAAVPLMLAIGSKFTGGKLLPAPDIEQTMLLEIVKGLNDKQLDALPVILGDEWPPMKAILEDTLNGNVRLQDFRAYVAKLPQEKTMAVVQLLNVGQQAAINELINGSNGKPAGN